MFGRGAFFIQYAPSLPPAGSLTRPSTGIPTPSSPSSPTTMTASLQHGNIAEMLEPAIEGPPSPESIRAFKNQLKQTSNAEKHQSQLSHQSQHSQHSQHSQQSQHSQRSQQSHHSHKAASSGSSSLRSLTSADRSPSWDQRSDATNSLSRKSSGRSSTSVQTRERHESVQIFGRSLFSKRGGNKIRRESSAQSSSSSLYSAETPYENGGLAAMPSQASPVQPYTMVGNPGGTNIFPSFFSRRRAATARSGADDIEARRRLNISGPYNFQHLNHTERDHLPSLQRGSRVALQSDFTNARLTQSPSEGSLRGIHADSLYFPDFSSDSLPLPADDASVSSSGRPRVLRQHSASVSAASSPSWTMTSQEQNRTAPPRPPRSPIDGPTPPPRMSSRGSVLFADADADAAAGLGFIRPQTSMATRLPAPLAFAAHRSQSSLPDAYAYSMDMERAAMEQQRYSQIFVPAPAPGPATAPAVIPDDANWPLASPITTNAPPFDILPGVPEEDEHVQNNRSSVRRSRMSMASNSSSLRGSQSLPMLRHYATQSQTSNGTAQRPPSNASDTLGRFDIFAVQRALREAVNDNDNANLPKESWEDDIDYCYEHAVEADCEYAWDRASLDVDRETVLAEMEAEDAHDFKGKKVATGYMSPSATSLTPGRFDVPSLSPASGSSITSTCEAVTPSGLAMRRPSLTIQTKIAEDESRPLQRVLHGRSGSRASSFKESHGFNLSPSLFIPGTEQYNRHRLAPVPHPLRGGPVGFAIGADDEEEEYLPAYKEPTMSMDTSTLLVSSRTSASTTASQESRDSMLSTSSERHISAASTATDLTRLTMSTASIEELMRKDEKETAPQVSPQIAVQATPQAI